MTQPPIVPMPDAVTYRCNEPGCVESFTHADPIKAHDLYLEHLDDHDEASYEEEDDELVPLTPAEVLADEDLAAQFYDDEVPD